MFPLNILKAGDRLCVCSFACSADDACRLREVGCVEGLTGKVLSNQADIIVQLGETRLGIHRKLAASILVDTQPVPS